MPWYIFAFCSAILQALYLAVTKKALKSIDKNVFAVLTFFCCSIILFFLSFSKGFPQVNNYFYYFIFLIAIFQFFVAEFSFKALKCSDLSLVVPMLSFTPVFLIGTSFFILHEIPSYFGFLGIFLIFIGSYLLNFEKNQEDILSPFKNIFKNKGVFYMFVAAIMLSFQLTFIKLAVLSSDKIFSSFASYALIALFFGIKLIASKKAYKDKHYFLPQFYGYIFLSGIVLATSAIFFNVAISIQDLSYVTAIKRFSVLIGVLFGFLFFREKNFKQRLLASFIMVVGALFIVLKG